MLNKILLFIFVFLVFTSGYYYFLSNYKQTKINQLEAEITILRKEKDACHDQIKKYNKAQTNAASKIEKIRTIMHTVKSDCDCYNTMLPNDVRKLLNGK